MVQKENTPLTGNIAPGHLKFTLFENYKEYSEGVLFSNGKVALTIGEQTVNVYDDLSAALSAVHYDGNKIRLYWGYSETVHWGNYLPVLSVNTN